MIIIAFTVASYCYQAAQPFYNAMLPDLAPPEEIGRLSGIGTAVGYIGTVSGCCLSRRSSTAIFRSSGMSPSA